jgi:vitamin B12 transporter
MAATLSPAGYAQTALEGIVVESATLAGTPADTATIGSSVTVITGAEMERRQIRHAADALRTVPGVAVGRTGGGGGMTQVRVRGAESNHLKVIIDGVEVNSLDTGDFDFSTLLADDIERIEIIRGPQSGIYGANALAGVINVVTRKGGSRARVTATAEAGSFGTHGVSANASGAGDKGYLSVTGSSRQTDGYNLARGPGEADGSEQKTIFARAGITPTDYFRVDVMARHQANDTEIDGFNFDGNFADDGILDDVIGASNLREQTMARISAQLDLFDKRWSNKVFADHLEDDLTSRDPFFNSKNDGERRRIGYLTTARLNSELAVPASHTLVGLVEKVDESFAVANSFGTAASRDRQTNALAAEYQGVFAETFFLTGNYRFDDKDTFEDAETYRLTAAYLFARTGTRLHASYGKGITDPTFFEQFGFALDFKGNANLSPEESVGWDAGVEQKLWDNRLTVDVTYFQAQLTNEIVTGSLDVDGDGIPDRTAVNQAGESDRKGVELTVSAQLTPNWLVTGSYTYTDATDPDGRKEIRRPPHAASLGAFHTFAEGRGQIGATVVYNGDTPDDQFGFDGINTVTTRQTLDAYTVVNIAASYKVDKNIELFGRVENLLDADYEEVFSYASAPVAAYGGVKVTFEEDAAIDAPLKR